MSLNAIGREVPAAAGSLRALRPFTGAGPLRRPGAASPQITAPRNSASRAEEINASRAEEAAAPRKLLSAARPSKILESVEEAIRRSGLESGMTISFHHHFREGDRLVNLVLDAAARMGIRGLALAPSSLTNIHEPLVAHCRSGVVRSISTSGLRGALAEGISRGLLEEPVLIHSHGGRARALREGTIRPDVAFIGAPSCDPYGNARGYAGKSACGSLGYAMVDARYARSVVVLTDGLEDYPAVPASIGQELVDWVVPVDAVGDPEGISLGATRLSKDPRELLIARRALAAIDASGLIREGFSFQTGSGGSSLAVVRYLRELMVERGLKAAFALGGISSQTAHMLEEGLVGALLDVQSFDRDAARSMAANRRHVEVDATTYADPGCAGAAVNMLDFVVLSALEVDLDFNVNVITGSDGVIRGASGGHCDTAAGASLAVVVAPLIRARTASVVDRVETVVTPGESVDLLVTDRGTAVNPRRADLAAALKAARIEVLDIRELREIARGITGDPEPVEYTDRVVGLVEYRDGTIIDAIRAVRSPVSPAKLRRDEA